MGQRHGEGGLGWTLANVNVGDDLISVKMTTTKPAATKPVNRR